MVKEGRTPRKDVYRNHGRTQKASDQGAAMTKTAPGKLQTDRPTPESPETASGQCQTQKTGANPQGKVSSKHRPLRSFLAAQAAGAAKRAENARAKINHYIWGDEPPQLGMDDETEAIANKVYSILKEENSPVLEYFERKDSCDLSELPPDVKSSFERAIRTQVQEVQRIGSNQLTRILR
ncbi:hypothetical protein SAMD00023353_5100510 [Rosellinia necatrix]|uniref:Uncharacterized protein n=1 Tax=Rosellinia necatrix TaxID=77044 RepID=A0A1W2TR27_ROSNE|nr:hypothetical protein SAMD00023353_5100510 [Rosellinia necatrix]